MSGDMTSSIVEERTTSFTLGSYIEDILNIEMVTIALPIGDVPVQYVNANGQLNFNISVIT